MATTTYDDNTFNVRAIGSRTNSAGTPVNDLTAEDDRLASSMVTAGWVVEPNSFVAAPGLAGTWTVTIGSTGARTDYYVVEGQATGQGNYITRLAASKPMTITAADPVNPRRDSIYLVVEDDTYDSNGRSLARLALRTGTAATVPAVPGPDAGWNAYAELCSIYVPAGAADILAATITDERTQTQLYVTAATLEGLAASAFSLGTHDHDATYADIAHVDSTDGHPVATSSLDGLMGGTTDKVKLNGIEAGAEVNLTASEILTSLKTVDGPGSGLDANKLDGYHVGSFSTSGHNHDTRYYTEAQVTSQLTDKRGFPLVCALKLTTTSSGYQSGVADIVPVNTEEYDEWNGSAGTIALVYARDIAYYLVTYQVTWQANSSGYRQLRLYQSNPSGRTLQTKKSIATGGGETTIINGSFVWKALAGISQYVALEMYQTSGSYLSIQKDLTWFRVVELPD